MILPKTPAEKAWENRLVERRAAHQREIERENRLDLADKYADHEEEDLDV